MNGQLGLWTAGMVAIAWWLVAVMVQTLSARRWWWLLGETGLAVLAHDWGWWGLERLRFRWTTADGQGLLLATTLSMVAIATLVLLLSQILLPAAMSVLSRSSRKEAIATPAPQADSDEAEHPDLPALPRRRRWELVVQTLLIAATNVVWGGALGLYAPP
ncbi:MAG: hypothetical protein AAFX40_15910 [Cyanobacteria bacterium J06639_1]